MLHDKNRGSLYNTFTASVDTNEDLRNLNINQFMMSTAEKDMSNHIQVVKNELNKSFENVINDFNSFNINVNTNQNSNKNIIPDNKNNGTNYKNKSE